MTLPFLYSTAALLFAAPLAGAMTIYGLGTNNHLYRIDTDNPSAAVDVGQISQAGIVDIDFHAANGTLYGITSTGLAYGIDLNSANATLLVTPASSLTGVQDFDFNPAADRMRLSLINGGNLRLVPDFITSPSPAGTSGAIVTDGTYSGAGPGVIIVANAYTNAFDTPGNAGAPHTTTLYSIGSDGILYSHSNGAGPAGSFGVMTAIGSGIGFGLTGNVGFDITAGNLALVNVENNLYSLNLSNGVFTDLPGTVGAPLASIAVPEPSTAILSALAGIALLRRRRRA
ncbi:DUF4394 domain-containing protein [Luteolibacter sp. GHJ8]|uniref:DUF4394 domain-containing protein n=1 Tax=Luteolibacter rhizosphaerae TaxID=2989719 RepID=A0ABT3G8M6_9BACT|nr:DUF4394 domain-containing protein [Luteolibacter rhizosphaerae]MCW1916206.1 DUF4394 domain-containing protein [Luteolibacter rhizosphaerae]